MTSRREVVIKSFFHPVFVCFLWEFLKSTSFSSPVFGHHPILFAGWYSPSDSVNNSSTYILLLVKSQCLFKIPFSQFPSNQTYSNMVLENPLYIYIMWVKQCHTTYKNGDDWGIVYCFTLIKWRCSSENHPAKLVSPPGRSWQPGSPSLLTITFLGPLPATSRGRGERSGG